MSYALAIQKLHYQRKSTPRADKEVWITMATNK
jgi:hypothetical protein